MSSCLSIFMIACSLFDRDQDHDQDQDYDMQKKGRCVSTSPRKKYLLKLEAVTQSETNGTGRQIFTDRIECSYICQILSENDLI
jgi:hypothetical protein